MAASARGFGAGTVQKLLAWHGRMSRWGEGMGAPRRAATAARRIEVQGASLPELSSSPYQESPLIRASALPMADREAVPPLEPTIEPRLQTLAALPKEPPTAPRHRGSAGDQDPATAERYVVPPSPPAARPFATPAASASPIAPSRAPAGVLRRRPQPTPPSATPSEPAFAPPGRGSAAAPAWESAAAPGRGPETEASWRPAIERRSPRASVSDESSGESGRMAVAVIEPQPSPVPEPALPVAAGRSGAEISVPAPDRSGFPAGSPGPAPSGQAVAKLIERTIRPVPVPGLEIRLLNPAPREGDDERAGRDTREPDAGARPRPAPPPVPPPPLDIDAVADKVYRLLQRRQRFERERKGRF